MKLSNMLLVVGGIIAFIGIFVGGIFTPYIEYEDLCKSTGGGKMVGTNCIYEKPEHYYYYLLAVIGLLIELSSVGALLYEH